jgi:hypothetical protein
MQENEEDFLPKEPIEPFMETPPPESKGGECHLKAPAEPLTKEKLANFLAELEDLVVHMCDHSREQQHCLAQELQQVKNMLHNSELPHELAEEFEKLTAHFNALLTHSAPLDREAVIKQIHLIVHQVE